MVQDAVSGSGLCKRQDIYFLYRGTDHGKLHFGDGKVMECCHGKLVYTLFRNSVLLTLYVHKLSVTNFICFSNNMTASFIACGDLAFF